jgi:CRISPR-associated endoribonuclease Cas6
MKPSEDMTTLYSCVLKLTNLYPITLTHGGGQHAHGAFFRIIEQVDPALSRHLHDIQGKGTRKPFTVSPLMGLPEPTAHQAKHWADSLLEKGFSQQQFVYLHEGWECWMRITILDDRLFKTFFNYFMNPKQRGMVPEIRLGDARFYVRDILSTPGSHPWAGHMSLEDLQKRLDEPPPSSITFEFHTPTSFKLSGNKVETLPYPKLVFGNLATVWKALTGENLVEAVEKYAEGNWRTVIHRIEPKALTLHNYPQLGAIGKVEYQRLADGDSPLARAFSLLADLAFYTGIGRKTTQGMGMVRRVVGPTEV